MANYLYIAGPAGSVVASRLAHTLSKPSVLLLEAGGPNDDTKNLSAAERFNVAFSPNSPMNWGYKTVPQAHLDGQEIDYSRGKGLGGSTAINFCGWTVSEKVLSGIRPTLETNELHRPIIYHDPSLG